MGNLKIILFNAPFNNFAMPLLGISSLKAFMIERGFIDIKCVDTNIEFFYHEMKIENIYEKGKEVIKFLPNKKLNSLILDWIIKNLYESICLFKNKELFWDLYKYEKAVRVVKIANAFLEWWDRLVINKPEIRDIPSINLKLIDEVIHKNYLFRFQSYFRERLSLLNNINIAGISIMFSEQIIPSFVMAAELKKRNPLIHITFGGAIISRFAHEIMKHAEIFKYVDSFIINEGEFPLENLSHQIKDFGEIKKPFENIIFKTKNGKIKGNFGKYSYNFKDIPFADFSDYSLKDYLVPEPILPILATSNCYYKKCSFCGHIIGKSLFQIRPVEKIIDSIKFYQAHYGVRHFYFTDNSLPPSFLLKFASKVIEEKLDIIYYGDCRPETLFTKNDLKIIRKSGGIAFYVGIESFSDRIQKLIGKGISASSAIEFIKRCHEANIGLKFNCFIGFPTETKKEALKTFRMIEKLRVDADMLALGRFVLEKDVEIYKNPKMFKIVITEPYDKEAELNLLFHFKPSKGISEKTSELLIKSFNKKYGFSVCRRSNILSRDHHTFFLVKSESRWFKEYKGPFINNLFQNRKINKDTILKLNEDILIYLINKSKKNTVCITL